jgi:GNAT superfamily N-acetyltransferase
MLNLRPLSLDDMEPIRIWRHGARETLRTPYMLTREQQEAWYRDVICDRRGATRYWGLWDVDGKLVGYGGIENIEWENRRGEISLLISPDARGLGYGREAVRLFLSQAFDYLNLETVWGEVYTCGHVEFWRRMVETLGGESVLVPRKKFWNGVYYGAVVFTFARPSMIAHEANGGRV